MTQCQKIVTSLAFFQFIANMELFGSMIPNAYKTYIFANTNLYLTKTENRTKKSLRQLPHYCFE